MKICFISPKAYPLFKPEIKSIFGGAEAQLFLLAKKITQKRKHDIHFMIADYGQNNIEKNLGITLWKSLNFKHNFFRKTFIFFKVFNKVNADIYIQRTLTIQSFFIALYCKIIKKKFVYMVAHDNEANQTHFLFKNMFSSYMIQLMFKLSDKIIVQNEYQKLHIQKTCKISKVFTLKKGIDFNNIKKQKTTKRYDAIWFGRCEEWKRPDIFLDLVKENPGNSFLMICPQATNKKEYLDKIKNIALGLDNLVFIDFMKNEDIYHKLSESKIFVFTSIQEGDWPMTVLEAAASRLFILSYSLNYEKLIDVYNGGFCCSDNFTCLNEKFQNIVRDENLLKKSGSNAFDYVNQYHNIDVNCDNFLKIIL